MITASTSSGSRQRAIQPHRSRSRTEDSCPTGPSPAIRTANMIDGSSTMSESQIRPTPSPRPAAGLRRPEAAAWGRRLGAAGAGVAPGAACADPYDCDPGFFCEPSLHQCLPQPDPLTCEMVPMPPT